MCYSEGKAGWMKDNIFRMILGGLTTVLGLIALVILTILSVEYQGAQYKADVVNREYGTNYSQQEMFYASDVINIVRELDRRRYEVNGDFRRQRDPQRDLPRPQK